MKEGTLITHQVTKPRDQLKKCRVLLDDYEQGKFSLPYLSHPPNLLFEMIHNSNFSWWKKLRQKLANSEVSKFSNNDPRQN